MGAQGQTLQDADGRIRQDADGRMMLLNADGTCPPCCEEEELGGPCCDDFPCTVVDNGAGNWTYTYESSFVGTVAVDSAPWADRAGNAPAHSGTYNVHATHTATETGLNKCEETKSHNWSQTDDYDGISGSESPSGIIDSSSMSISPNYYDFTAPTPVEGVEQFDITLSATIGVNSVGLSTPSGTLVAGTQQFTGGKIILEVTSVVDTYVRSDGMGNAHSRASGELRLVVQVYEDGGYAVWDTNASQEFVSTSVSVAPEYSGGCVRGAEVSFTIMRRNFADPNYPLTTHAGTAGVRWAAGVRGCPAGDAMRGCAGCGDGGESPGEPE